MKGGVSKQSIISIITDMLEGSLGLSYFIMVYNIPVCDLLSVSA